MHPQFHFQVKPIYYESLKKMYTIEVQKPD